jgi:tetratricopeptide (TPR) repeat protein
LAGYYRQTNQREKAIQFYEKLVKLNPDNITVQQDLEELKAQK